MKRFVEGSDRSQSNLFPECLDDLIDENNPVRVVEAFVNELDLGDLGVNATRSAILPVEAHGFFRVKYQHRHCVS